MRPRWVRALGLAVPAVLLGTLVVLVFALRGPPAGHGLGFVQLTFDGPGVANEFPVASPDGKYLLIQRCDQPGVTKTPDGRVRYDFKEGESNWDIWRMRVDGSERVRLTDSPGVEDEPAWSPDGKTIAYRFHHQATFAIWLMDADGRNKRALVDDPHSQSKAPSFSPDGRKVIFYANRAARQEWNLYTIDLKNRVLKQLTTGGFQDKHPQFTPDGHEIIFHSDRNRLSIDAGATHALMRIYSLDLGSGQFKLLADSKELRDDRHAFVSPDGRHLVFHSLAFGSDPLRANQYKKIGEDIVIAQRDGSRRINVTEGDARYFKHPSWSADGKRIYCVFKHKRGDGDQGSGWNLCSLDVSAMIQAR